MLAVGFTSCPFPLFRCRWFRFHLSYGHTWLRSTYRPSRKSEFVWAVLPTLVECPYLKPEFPDVLLGLHVDFSGIAIPSLIKISLIFIFVTLRWMSRLLIVVLRSSLAIWNRAIPGLFCFVYFTIVIFWVILSLILASWQFLLTCVIGYWCNSVLVRREDSCIRFFFQSLFRKQFKFVSDLSFSSPEYSAILIA